MEEEFLALLILQTCKVEQDEFEPYRSGSALEEPSVFNLETCLASQGFIYNPFCPGNIFSRVSSALSLTNSIYK